LNLPLKGDLLAGHCLTQSHSRMVTASSMENMTLL
jgi:hypothetical protein